MSKIIVKKVFNLLFLNYVKLKLNELGSWKEQPLNENIRISKMTFFIVKAPHISVVISFYFQSFKSFVIEPDPMVLLKKTSQI